MCSGECKFCRLFLSMVIWPDFILSSHLLCHCSVLPGNKYQAAYDGQSFYYSPWPFLIRVISFWVIFILTALLLLLLLSFKCHLQRILFLLMHSHHISWQNSTNMIIWIALCIELNDPTLFSSIPIELHSLHVKDKKRIFLLLFNIIKFFASSVQKSVFFILLKLVFQAAFYL